MAQANTEERAGYFGRESRTLNASAIYPREIIQSAVKHNAAALIFVHNHPAGNPQPSDNDKQITQDLVFAGNIMQIKVLDHIIIGENRYFSFADAGLIDVYNSLCLSLKEVKRLKQSEIEFIT